MKLEEILLLIAACIIVLGITYLTVIICSDFDIERDEKQLIKEL